MSYKDIKITLTLFAILLQESKKRPLMVKSEKKSNVQEQSTTVGFVDYIVKIVLLERLANDVKNDVITNDSRGK